jgi:hypothetical protein
MFFPGPWALGYLYENVFRRGNNIVAGTGMFWKSIEFDNGSIGEAYKSVKVTMGNIPRGILKFRVNIIGAPWSTDRIASPAIGPEPLYLTPSTVSAEIPPFCLRIFAIQ